MSRSAPWHYSAHIYIYRLYPVYHRQAIQVSFKHTNEYKALQMSSVDVELRSFILIYLFWHLHDQPSATTAIAHETVEGPELTSNIVRKVSINKVNLFVCVVIHDNENFSYNMYPCWLCVIKIWWCGTLIMLSLTCFPGTDFIIYRQLWYIGLLLAITHCKPVEIRVTIGLRQPCLS